MKSIRFKSQCFYFEYGSDSFGSVLLSLALRYLRMPFFGVPLEEEAAGEFPVAILHAVKDMFIFSI